MEPLTLTMVGIAILHFFIGMVWYSPLLFGKQWMKEMGYTNADMKKMEEKGMAGTLLASLISSLVMVYVMAHLVGLLGLSTYAEGAELGAWIWLGFMATLSLGSILWEGKSLTYYLINNAYTLVSFAVVGALLAGM